VTFRLDDSGALVSPPPCQPEPVPAPLPLAELSSEQSKLWATAQTAGTTNAIQACQNLLDSHPPKRIAAAAQYQLGALLLQEHKNSDATKAFETVATNYADAIGESGLPLQPLAEFKLLELKSFPVESFCSNIVFHPTLLSPFLLRQVTTLQTNEFETVRSWQALWAQHERAREVFAAAHDQLRDNFSFLPAGTNRIENTSARPAVVWFVLPTPEKVLSPNGTLHNAMFDENWIATRTPSGTNWFICRPGTEWGRLITLQSEHVPSYFGVAVDAGGRRVTTGAPSFNYWHDVYVPGDAKGAGQHWAKAYGGPSTNLLASAAHVENGAEQLRVSVYLTNPAELFASQHSRAVWFGLVVIASTVAALIGLFAAARTFRRQERLAELKSNFVSSVSHELRAPIASVRLMAESLERGKIDQPQKQGEYFRFIVQECRRLSSLIENVLDFSRIEQGRKQYEFEPTDLLGLTRETVKLMEPYAEEKGVRLELDSKLETQNPELEIDGRAIQQALVNLIDNAIKHSPRGQTVTVGLARAQPAVGAPLTPSDLSSQLKQNNSAADTVQLYVEDHGPGIPPREHEKIFERFYRLGSELRRETQGVGIGLSIVKHIVEAHGGHVTVRSNVAQGSRFTIELPENSTEQADEAETK